MVDVHRDEYGSSRSAGLWGSLRLATTPRRPVGATPQRGLCATPSCAACRVSAVATWVDKRCRLRLPSSSRGMRETGDRLLWADLVRTRR
jgi:hypothetical protein